ncbi:MAG TPA: hypothetical protein VH280_14910 [Verrucomicrobiae bacterium]|jgi:hypothetical protein|nr:hypothetical protein [Verrucomicrobiae bacterium]
MDATAILQTITLGVSAWALLELIGLKIKLARMEQKLDDLPCQDCPEAKPKTKLKFA